MELNNVIPKGKEGYRYDIGQIDDFILVSV